MKSKPKNPKIIPNVYESCLGNKTEAPESKMKADAKDRNNPVKVAKFILGGGFRKKGEKSDFESDGSKNIINKHSVSKMEIIKLGIK